MFNTIPNTTIDMVQMTKKLFVDFYVPQDSLKQALNLFVDAQTEYTKDAYATFLKVGTQVADSIVNKTLYNETIDTFQSTMNSLLKVK